MIEKLFRRLASSAPNPALVDPIVNRKSQLSVFRDLPPVRSTAPSSCCVRFRRPYPALPSAPIPSLPTFNGDIVLPTRYTLRQLDKHTQITTSPTASASSAHLYTTLPSHPSKLDPSRALLLSFLFNSFSPFAAYPNRCPSGGWLSCT